ncbi:MAG TPA: S1/P1 nuclease [Elusimicrobiota bacterium]|nr:S1/P1 nuclease [Elusimicrobiota bacterium]
MRTPRAFLPTLILAALSCPRAARAWSANGHKTVALIAQSRLSPAAKAAVASLLGSATIDGVAPCADDVRGKTGYVCDGIPMADDPQSQPWHFVDAPIADSPSGGQDLEAYCPNQACVIDQINAEVEVLKTSTAQADRQLALIFLIHFVGDEHQPLHCADEIVNGVNDRGGNLKSVSFRGVSASQAEGPNAAAGGLNLHALWDHQILPGDTNDPGQESQRLIADLQGKDVSGWTSGDFVHDAAFESYSIAKGTVYPAYYAPNGRIIDSNYQAKMKPIVDERLERAGVRLAALLESALGGPPVAAPSQTERSGASALDKARRRVKGAENLTPP